jgi:hypothetical protein
MDIFEKVAIEIPCAACGGRYELSLRQVMLSQQMMHEGCPVHADRDCPPRAYSDLVDEETLKELQRVWARLEVKAQGAGGQIRLRSG